MPYVEIIQLYLSYIINEGRKTIVNTIRHEIININHNIEGDLHYLMSKITLIKT